ncbi:Transcription initiation factor TFIID subunit 10 [Fasciolopsis buskii]|uniref:Transcription initiation factor TFIID subunit 10 n=1 Tax=Fasciolopsis buskii TaxID=27845 RepID=A0A8E0S0X4_9TREM|nr:Transcription initiation factor TFIID subunit 10 [Fasciolopsis buski]
MTLENGQPIQHPDDRLGPPRQLQSGIAGAGNSGRGQEVQLLANLWTQLDQIQPTSDVRLARLASLAGQKFLTDVIADAMSHWRIANGLSSGLLNSTSHSGTGSTTSTTPTNSGITATSGAQGSGTPTTPQSGTSPSPTTPGRTPTSGPGTRHTPDRRATLTLDDLIASLNDRGIHVARPPYYR